MLPIIGSLHLGTRTNARLYLNQGYPATGVAVTYVPFRWNLLILLGILVGAVVLGIVGGVGALANNGPRGRLRGDHTRRFYGWRCRG